jgi:hypothetical protein
MARRLPLISAAVVLFALSSANIRSFAQTENSSHSTSGVVLINLFRPAYPPLALQARVSGDVDLTVAVRQDGSVESAIANDGPSLLKQAALNSAQHSKFECRGCTEILTPYQLLYSFQLGPTEHCSTKVVKSNPTQQEPTYPQVVQTQNRITLLDRPTGTCDTEVFLEKRVRSAKCLYLWRCGWSNAGTIYQ